MRDLGQNAGRGQPPGTARDGREIADSVISNTFPAAEIAYLLHQTVRAAGRLQEKIMTRQFFSAGLMLKAGTIILALCLGAGAMHAWQARGSAVETTGASPALSSSHAEARVVGHRDSLPVAW
jgi:hypothetical protein